MDPIQSFLDSYQQNDSDHIPRPACCCGNEACAYLRHNQSALDGLEKDVSTAARLGKACRMRTDERKMLGIRACGRATELHAAKVDDGMSGLMFSLQALLVRHESYIADSERERREMTAHIGMLEKEKQVLEKKNATVIEENRNLLDQLEAVNSAVSESDAHVVNLQATLQSTQQELHKLSQLAARTESLERQLAEYEREQATWQNTFEAKEESEKSALRRWQKAERTLAQLQDQIERIEREAKEEHERHHEVVERMERRHAVEKELGSAAGRLKGAAAAKNGAGEGEGTNVVSHFVKDILQDNANLQMGIVELREMLNNSNEEVETLRKQLQTHQPVEDEQLPTKVPAKRDDLRQELNRANSSELHVHHHYHAPSATPKPQTLRRPKKKRLGSFTPGSFTPPSRSGTPRSFSSYNSPTPTAAILQQTAASIPQPVPMRNRWSMQSNNTYHSMLATSGPSSPQSTTNRTSSIFDRVFSDAGMDSSRPTTPDTEDPGSPVFAPTYSKRDSQSSFRTYSAPNVSRGGINNSGPRQSLDSILSIEELPKLDQHVMDPEPIPEEPEGEWENESSVPDGASNVSPMSEEMSNPLYDQSFYRPHTLRRATSHESILSVSRADGHGLKTRPSQLLAPYGGRGITSQAVTSDTTAHADRPAAMSRPSANSKNLLSGMAADQRQQAAPASKPSASKKTGGWIFGRWGATPAHYEETAPSAAAPVKSVVKKSASQSLASDNLAAQKPSSASSAGDKVASPVEVPAKKPTSSSSAGGSMASPDAQATPRKIKARTPGINQSGPIEGFFPEVRSPIREPLLKSLDEEGLRRLLDGK
ncbi:uncharacterized protein LTR77_004262 [Saxophila tyrrhenica]|uniref:Uncharacterized protein n=1 Tax=Saxophila tyrrhenica TaxID=1690608 RepID=A0AAV9PGG8_9PEZI|nr:hypothetical protein LTR77_004262 [Saxophila tyrrhenica]